MEYKTGQPPVNPPADSPSGDVPVKVQHPIGKYLILGVLAVLAWLTFTYLRASSVAMVIVGLSFVIFIHELGHFLVAKWSDVHVTHFSIGFGPKIPGCWFIRGETTYQLCLIPLGGYVQMVGQVDGDEGADMEEDPRSYRKKSVWQRMAIISAGVIMNAITAVICFIVVFRGPGKDRIAAVISAVDSSGPAFVEGARTGSVIEQIGDTQNPYFDDLKAIVGGSASGEQIRFVAKRPGDKTGLDVMLESRKSKEDLNPVVGLAFANQAKMKSARDVGYALKSPAQAETPAANAQPAFEFDDIIVGMSDIADPTKVTPLPDDPRKPVQKDYFEFTRRLQILADREVIVRVQRKGSGKEETPKEFDIKVQPAYRTSLGFQMEMGEIVAIRKGSPAAEANVRVPDAAKNLWGDLIQKVEVPELDGKTTVFENETLDPERLPFDLRAWAVRMGDKKAEVTIHLRRHREGAGNQFNTEVVKIRWDADWTFDRALPINPSSPTAIPELGLGYSVKTTIAAVKQPGTGLKVGDVVKNVKLVVVDHDGKEVDIPLSKKDFGPNQWSHFGATMAVFGKIAKVHLKIERDKSTENIEYAPFVDKSWPLVDRGWMLKQDLRLQKADTIVEAIQFGLSDTRKMMVQILRNLRNIVTGRIAIEQLGGPLTIGHAAYHTAVYDPWEFVFFLGMISINLAVINFLPIPVLDGGHMVFLLYEQIIGKPAPDGVRAVITYAGLAFILCLMILVISLDIRRFFFS